MHADRIGALTQLWVMSPKHAAVAAGGAGVVNETTESLALQENPKGPPTSYGPMPKEDERQLAVNPFWSEKVKDEAVLRSLRPRELPESSSARSPQGLEDGNGSMDPRHLLAMLLQQNAQLKQELTDLKGQVAAQASEVTEKVLERVEERKKDGPTDTPLQLMDRQPPALEDVKSEGKSEELGLGMEWRTPMNRYQPRSPKELVQIP